MTDWARKGAAMIAGIIGLSLLASPLQSQNMPSASVPDLPPAPVLDASGYPQCREDYQKSEALNDRAAALNACTDAIDRYYRETLLNFRDRMIAHQSTISRLYTERVAGRSDISGAVQQDFYRRMMAEHAASNPDGANLAAWREAEARYKADRTYLQDRYCFTTGCGGYPAPVATAAKAKSADKPKAEKAAALQPTGPAAASAGGNQSCGKARKRGSALGGLIGGVAGRAAGLKNAGSLFAAAFSGVLVGEIACQLNEKEQEKAAQATVEVTKKEEVGATATWQSPTRAGVSGSSMVTAINATPNGKKCLSITDVAIIDGVETLVKKQMCREPGASAYKIVAV